MGLIDVIGMSTGSPAKETKAMRTDIAIVGAGASGALTATRILRAGFAGSLTMVSGDDRVARGVAYGVNASHLLLNVKAGNLSAFAESPADFVDWLALRGASTDGLAESFQPRGVYGDYLSHTLRSAVKSQPGSFEVVLDEATSLDASPTGCSIGLKSGREIVADAVVLALGVLPPETPAACAQISDHPRWIGNPWAPCGLARIGKQDTVEILGTGLTMVDLVLSLRSQGHEGRIFARSRHGLIPHPHAPHALKAAPCPENIRELIRACRDAGYDWRGVVDSVRKDTPRMWGVLTWEERRRVGERLMSFWNVHRHRMPESVARTIALVQAEGFLGVAAGKLMHSRAIGDRIALEFEQESLVADWVINGTGPSSNWRAARVPILESAVANGLFAYDPLGMGVVVDDVGRTGSSGRVWSIGAIRRGCQLETTAIAEIRAQAHSIAEDLLLRWDRSRWVGLRGRS